MLDILSLTLDELTEQIILIDELKYRAKQIFTWLHVKKISEFSEMTDIPKALIKKLNEKFILHSYKPTEIFQSFRDNTVKYLFMLSDGEYVETVVMRYKRGISVCVSTQVGCKMGCKFCASGIAGFIRNLSPGEIVAQIYAAERISAENAAGVVLMGIGEPLDNFDNTVRFLNVISDKAGRNMSLRHVSVSTCGIVPKIYSLAELKTGITLSISLHAATDIKRSKLMPVNDVYNISALIKACDEYLKLTGRRVSFEYSVIDGENNSREDADALIKLLKTKNCHVNLIPVNSIRETTFHSGKKSAEAFKLLLTKGGLNVTVRRTLGTDIDAACGQLRRTKKDTAKVK
ncbi:MAG: 23S rRNA (adenine(2503)-C(2))-methyltransferase RlmN [Ruminococcus sp.]|jgi:23S rRNA (adenine2503-C2)-methyltransferase|nr:23S rRNA (adenine(2503)-C(2))-methyltransferase RlmN [Ruminococcus sp.]